MARGSCNVGEGSVSCISPALASLQCVLHPPLGSEPGGKTEMLMCLITKCRERFPMRL